MQIIEPRVEVDVFDPQYILQALEFRGRRCYKSEEAITPTSAAGFIKDKVHRKHLSIIEHEKVSVNFVIDRGVSHELVRHRLASYSQESTRYCNYGKQDEITVIRPFWAIPGAHDFNEWRDTLLRSQDGYLNLLSQGWKPQQARDVLPNSLKTEVETTFNLREWQHFFTERCSPAAHPQMRQVSIPLLLYFQRLLPQLFADIPYDSNFDPANYAQIVPRDLKAIFAADDTPPRDWDAFLNRQTDIHVAKDRDYKSRFMRKLCSCENLEEARAVWKWEVEKKLDRVRTWIDTEELAVKGEGINNAVGDAFNYTVQYAIFLWATGANFDPLKHISERDFYGYAAQYKPSQWIEFWDKEGLVGVCEMPEMRPVLLTYMGVKQ